MSREKAFDSLHLSQAPEYLEFERSTRFLDSLLRKLLQPSPPSFRAVRDTVLQSLEKVVRGAGINSGVILRFLGKDGYFLLKKVTPAEVAFSTNEERTDRELVELASVLELPILREIRKDRRRYVRAAKRREIDQLGLGDGDWCLCAEPIIIARHIYGAIVCCKRITTELNPFSMIEQTAISELAHVMSRLLARIEFDGSDLNATERAVLGARLAGLKTYSVSEHGEPDETLMRRFRERVLMRLEIAPLSQNDSEELTVLCANPMNFRCFDEFEMLAGQSIVKKIVVSTTELGAIIERTFHPEAAPATGARLHRKVAQEFSLRTAGNALATEQVNQFSPPIVRLANDLIEQAYNEDCSDIHVEPYDDESIIRFRLDGLCKTVAKFPISVHQALVNRFKIMAELDIAEHRLPQDGRIDFYKYSPGYQLELRVSVAPLRTGESIVMRILDSQKAIMPLSALGMSQESLNAYEKAINTPYGLVLHTGPTGSGKSMSLYAALNRVTNDSVKVLTAEDPVEYSIPGIQQMQVDHKIGLTFARALRCFLRQDPDIILIGEIRDPETAKVGIEAALTGHRLFSTLHTNNAIDTVIRLGELGVPTYLLAPSLVAICAQRLVRKLCRCSETFVLSQNDREFLRQAGLRVVNELKRPVGCDRCGDTGYKGRTGIYELLVMTEDMRDQIHRGYDRRRLIRAARQTGMTTLLESGYEKAITNVSSLSEIQRVCSVIDVMKS